MGTAGMNMPCGKVSRIFCCQVTLSEWVGGQCGRRRKAEVIASRPWEGIDELVWVTAFMITKLSTMAFIHAPFKMGGILASWLYGGLEAQLESHSRSDHINRFNKSLD